jgi:hypothetical protein
LLDEEAFLPDPPPSQQGFLTGWYPEKKFKIKQIEGSVLSGLDDKPEEKSKLVFPASFGGDWELIKARKTDSLRRLFSPPSRSIMNLTNPIANHPTFIKSMVKKAELLAQTVYSHKKSGSVSNLCLNGVQSGCTVSRSNLTQISEKTAMSPPFTKFTPVSKFGCTATDKFTNTVPVKPNLRSTDWRDILLSPPRLCPEKKVQASRIESNYLSKNNKMKQLRRQKSSELVTTSKQHQASKEELSAFKIIFLETCPTRERARNRGGAAMIPNVSPSRSGSKMTMTWEPRLKNQQVWRLKMLKGTASPSHRIRL